MKELKIYTVPGFKFGAVEAAIKKPGRLDLSLIYSEVPATPAAVFTKNKVKAAPVLLDMEVLKGRTVRAIVANSGNANACNGLKGMNDALKTAHLTGEALGVNTSDVFVASTGVIGANLPMDRMAAGVKLLPAALKEDGLLDAAKAIMTTDTFPKIYGVSEKIGGKEIRIAGIAKGSGMINPDMATMLSFIITDAAVEKRALSAALKEGVDDSFNCVTVDGDTSTNDTVIILANGMAGNETITQKSAEYEQFKEALGAVLLALSKMVAKDGEGATKLVEVVITGAANPADAKKAAKAVSNSPLVKTALFAEDANWGRIACAAGYSGAKMDAENLEIWFDKVCMVKGGVGLGPKAEEKASQVLKKKEFKITVNLGVGEATARVFTTDLSYEYVKINAGYRS